jgi:hypothetical protein
VTSIKSGPRVAIFNNTATGGHFGCEAVMSSIEAQLIDRGAEIALSWPVDCDWRSHKKFLRAQAIDLIVVNGEGSIHHTASRAKAMYLCELGSFAREELKVPAYLINSTMEAVCKTAMGHLKAFDGVYVRESRSHDYLKGNGVIAAVVPDLSIYSPMVVALDVERGPILVTDSVMKSASDTLEYLAEHHGWEYRKMEHAVSQTLLGRVRRKLKNRLLSPKEASRFKQRANNESFYEFFARVKGAEGVLTGRFHSVMLSIAARTPFLAIESNTAKIGSVIEDVFGSKNRVISLMDVCLDRSEDRWVGVSKFSEDELKRLDEYVLNGRAGMVAMFDFIIEGFAN